ncbi:hypothetical protein SAY87_019926 [Trapa incisa]|uniref:VASt domain-containing protein n=1 Tax=Trapa incisa TaxID=236973 RepID=A0AAN7K0M2_9MYRT|nr:hypothetical protein SAY87_019926 [Trapa incisa]
MAGSSSSTVNDESVVDASPSKSALYDAPLSVPVPPSTGDAAVDRCDSSNSPAETQRESEFPSAAAVNSEIYRLLFRLPPEEVFLEHFNCACQENILVQGHMYLFVHCICFYSNIFGFETKKIIHFRDVTSVKRAKTAGIFSNAIEIFAGEKKYFFASFLSRDEAYKLIIDGWVQHGNGAKAIMEKQDSASESSFRENGIGPEKVKCSDSEDFTDIKNCEDGSASTGDSKAHSMVEDDNATTTVPVLQENGEPGAAPEVVSEPLSPAQSWTWKVEDSDAPKRPECYTKVAETTFQIMVEDFFSLFFSDDAVDFMESFHKRCGDKEFKCASWMPHDQYGHTRNVRFQHPIKLYLGAKFGSCQEMQKFRVYKSGHLIIDTSQEVTDVPYGDYFRVEGLWDVRKDGERGCILSVYINVPFSKKTMFRGKIIQSTLEECREAYAIWVDRAHDLLRERNLEQKRGEVGNGQEVSMIQTQELQSARETNTGNSPEPFVETNNNSNLRLLNVSNNTEPRPLDSSSLFQGIGTVAMMRESMVKLWSYIKSQKHLPPLLTISFAVILLMQFSIVLLLTRPQNIHVISQTDYMGGMGIGERSAWLEKRIHYLKDEMSMLESQLERMQWEHGRLKEQLRDLQQFVKQRE